MKTSHENLTEPEDMLQSQVSGTHDGRSRKTEYSKEKAMNLSVAVYKTKKTNKNCNNEIKHEISIYGKGQTLHYEEAELRRQEKAFHENERNRQPFPAFGAIDFLDLRKLRENRCHYYEVAHTFAKDLTTTIEIQETETG